VTKSDDGSALLLRKMKFMARHADQMAMAKQRVERKLYEQELRSFQSNYVISNLSREIEAQKERIARIENATSLQIARKIRKYYDRWAIILRPKKRVAREAVFYDLNTNRARMQSKIDQILNNQKSTVQENLWVNQLPQRQQMIAYEKQLQSKCETPKISILLPVYNIEGKWLLQAIQSVLEQLYQNWELCIVDDASQNEQTLDVLNQFETIDKRIKVQYQKENQGISKTSNRALGMAEGEYITFLDHDDFLSPNALFEVYRVIQAENADFIYSDEAIVNPLDKIVNIFFKPDFSPDFLLSLNYINHLMVIRKSLLDQCGGFRSGVDGAQDYDVALKTTEKAKKAYHIHKILYFWRLSTGTFSATNANKQKIHDAGRRAIEYALNRRGVEAVVYPAKRIYNYHVKRAILRKPKVSIIIPFKDKFELLEKCLESVLFNTDYDNYEIIGMDNASSRPETIEGMRFFEKLDTRIAFYPYQGHFNYSKINNLGVTHATGEHIVLMNSDIEIINSDWLQALLSHSQRNEVGAVGGKLYYPNDTIQHGGVILGIAGFAGHSHRHSLRGNDGSMNRLVNIQNISAVTGALLMVKKSYYNDVGGLDEVNLQIALNDIDFCLKLREKGYINVFTPYCEAYHHESMTRGYDTTSDQKNKFEQERNFFTKKWATHLTADPYYNKNLTLEREDFSLKQAAELSGNIKPLP
jgi:glycosyltransferase involved in cell wall biosynthesis